MQPSAQLVSEKLLVRLQEQDPAAWQEVMEKVGPSVMGTITRLTAGTTSEADVDDIFQLSFLRALGAIDQIREPGVFLPWLRMIAVDQVRRRWKQLEREPLVLLEDVPPQESRESSPDKKFDWAKLNASVARLKPEEREAIELRYFANFKLAKAAAEIGLSESDYEKLLRQALARLREQIEGKQWRAPVTDSKVAPINGVRTAQVVELLPSGLGYLTIPGIADRTFSFKVGRVLENYNGRPYSEFGLVPNAKVSATLKDDKVERITVLPEVSVQESSTAADILAGKLGDIRLSEVRQLIGVIEQMTPEQLGALIARAKEELGIGEAEPTSAAAQGVGQNTPEKLPSFEDMLKQAPLKREAIAKIRAAVAGLSLAEAKALVEQQRPPTHAKGQDRRAVAL